MKLGTRIFICYLLIFIVCFYYPIDWIMGNLRTRYLEGVEDPLVDQANILASLVGKEMETQRFDPDGLYLAFENAYTRPVSARIYSLMKTRIDMHMVITDASGQVVFDSLDRKNIGADYSDWRDVKLTLAGQYGARTTLKDIHDPTSSVLYVSAPIMVGGEIAGVLTIGKPTTNINNFLKKAKPQIIGIGSVSVAIAVILTYLVSIWLTRPIKRLTQYANDIHAGKRAPFPKLDKSEVGEMGHAFQKMQEALEGRKYVEHYVQNLTHELKSPLSGIRGAAELLEEDMPPAQRAQFLSNIRNEVNRIQEMVDKMLQLAALENLKALQKTEIVSFGSLVKTVVQSKHLLLSAKKLRVSYDGEKDLRVRGDSFLLHQAVSNLIQNAIDFSPAHGRIVLTTRMAAGNLTLMVEDNGPGIPAYAERKIFDRFFSLKRPDSGMKSTGLGLNFVKEVAILHDGDVVVENRSEKGVRATLTFPVKEIRPDTGPGPTHNLF